MKQALWQLKGVCRAETVLLWKTYRCQMEEAYGLRLQVCQVWRGAHGFRERMRPSACGCQGCRQPHAAALCLWASAGSQALR